MAVTIESRLNTMNSIANIPRLVYGRYTGKILSLKRTLLFLFGKTYREEKVISDQSKNVVDDDIVDLSSPIDVVVFVVHLPDHK